MNHRLRYILLLSILLFAEKTSSQIIPSPLVLEKYQRGWEMMNRGMVYSALRCFREANRVVTPLVSNNLADYSSLLLSEDAAFYETYCLKMAGDSGADARLSRFVNEYPYHPKIAQAFYLLATADYHAGRYEDALKYFKKIDPLALSENENYDVQYKMAQAYFEIKMYDEAIPLFNKLKDKKNPYQEAAIYHFGYINYIRRDFETAIRYFEQLKKSKEYGEYYSYYRAAILFLDERYDEVISYVAPIIADDEAVYNLELIKILAHSYFFKNRYKEAASSFSKYSRNNGKNSLTPQDIYQYGYSYYQEKDYAKAIAQLKRLEKDNSIFGQRGLLILADAYLRTGDKVAARNYFQASMQRSGQDEKVQEEAYLNYIKISCELFAYPIVITSGKDFLTKFPNSKHTPEVSTMLALAYLKTRNYQESIDILESIEERAGDANEIYQQATYYRGIQYFKDRAFENCISALIRSLEYPLDETIYALSLYWQAEAMYEVSKFKEATESFENFVQVPAAKSTEVYTNAFYALGYSAFQNKDYPKSIRYFESFVSGKSIDRDTIRIPDAYMRLADSYFTLKEYDAALKYYNKSIDNKLKGCDYALFQKGMILGLKNKIKEKIQVHELLIRKYPQSLYADDANFEIAYSYFLKGDNKRAREELLNLTNNFPQSPYVPKALITVGLAYYNDSEDEQALAVLKRLVKDYASSDEAKQALKTIENVYITQGDADSFFEYIQTVPNATYSMADKDNILFQAISNRFQKEDYKGTIHGVTGYFEKFPEPLHQKEAQFFRAESYLATNEDLSAAADYEEIVKDWTSIYTRKALLSLAKIYMKHQKYNDALPHLKKIELTSENNKVDYEYAIYSLLHVFSELNRQDELLHYAQLVEAYPGAPEAKKSFASYSMGKVLLSRGDTVSAANEFQLAAKHISVHGAESKYQYALIQYAKGIYKEAQKTILELNEKMSDFTYWVARGFILLSKCYSSQKNFTQALVTLKSVIDNYDNKEDGVLDEAKQTTEQIKTEQTEYENMLATAAAEKARLAAEAAAASTTLNTVTTVTGTVNTGTINEK